MGHPGFSYIGLIFLLLLIIPNLVWTRFPPKGYDPSGENPVLRGLERAGEAAVTCCALAFSDFNLRPWSAWCWWLVAAAVLMVLYELWWLRYFRSPRTLDDFYRSFLGIPVAGAVLPVAAFFLLGIYGRVVWLPLAAVVLGIGHIGIHLQHCQGLSRTTKE